VYVAFWGRRDVGRVRSFPLRVRDFFSRVATARPETLVVLGTLALAALLRFPSIASELPNIGHADEPTVERVAIQVAHNPLASPLNAAHADFAVFAGQAYGRYFSDRRRYRADVRRYEQLFARYCEVLRTNDLPGRELRVFDLKCRKP
jgi:hypothetical protein